MHGCPFIPTDWWRKSISQNFGRNSGWLTGILVFFTKRYDCLGLGVVSREWVMVDDGRRCVCGSELGPVDWQSLGRSDSLLYWGSWVSIMGILLTKQFLLRWDRGIFSIFHGSSILTHTHNKTVLVSWNLRILGGEKIREMDQLRTWIFGGPVKARCVFISALYCGNT